VARSLFSFLLHVQPISPGSILLHPGLAIAQLPFTRLSHP
jgi:hypothetical protein